LTDALSQKLPCQPHEERLIRKQDQQMSFLP